MRSKLLIFLMLIFIVYLAAADSGQPVKSSRDFEFKGYVPTQSPGDVREQDPPPTYEFILNGAGGATTYLYDSYYDYMPYSYNGFNVHKQPEISLPYGYSAGGFYISYHVSETTNTGTDRRAWNSYLNPDGTLLSSTATNQYSVIREGYTSSDIDPVTADPFFAWHSVVETDGSYDCSMTYDNYHLTGSTGYWKLPFILFDNPEVAEPFTGHQDEYIWPVIMIGDSPLDGHRRIHGYANGYTTNSAGYYLYNSVYGYADFNADSLLYESNLSWTYKTFPWMDEQHYNDLERVNKDMIVKGNMVAFFGDYGDTLFCHLSEDYGENFTLYTQEWNYPVENPIGTNGEYYWYDDDTVTPSEMVMVPSSDGTHYNGVFTKDDSRIVWMTGININSLENISQELYMAAFFYPKVFWFDLNTHTFDFYCMDLQGVDPADDQPCIPWDLDENGEVDEYYDDGGVYVPLSMSSYFFGTDQGYQDSFFHESAFHMAANGDYLVVIWQDCKKHRWAHFGTDGYDSWFQQPEVMISYSKNGGDTWSDPLVMNANPDDAVIDPENNLEGHYVPEFADMILEYFVIGKELEVIDDDPQDVHLIAHFAFFDDNDYGGAAASSQGSGTLNGGKCRYFSLDLGVGPAVSGTDDNIIPNADKYLSQNYPNPFNPVTAIKYSIPQAGDVNLTVYNIKGQKVKTLVSSHQEAGSYRIEWDGTDDQGTAVTSGMYFYTLDSERVKSTKKMILLK